MKFAEAAHMGFVENRILPRDVGLGGIAPGEGRVDDPAARHERSAVAFIERQVAVCMADGVAKQRIVPLQLT
ncbi:hypothetical protein D9M71_720570 [compost metagenome]